MEDRKYKVIDGPAVVLGFSECRPEDETPLDALSRASDYELASLKARIAAVHARQREIDQRRDELVNDHPGLKAV